MNVKPTECKPGMGGCGYRLCEPNGIKEIADHSLFASKITDVHAYFVAHAILSPFAAFAFITSLKFSFFKAGIAIFQFAASAMLIFFGLLDFPHFTVANIDDSIFAVGNFLDAIRFAKAVTASTHARFALSRFDIHASHLLPIVVFALVVVASHAVHSRTSVLIHAIALSGHAIVIGNVPACFQLARTRAGNR